MSTYSPEINTTPLIDVLLVLLVILILSVPPMADFVGLTLPSGPARKVLPERINIDIDFDGQVFWNGRHAADMQILEQWFHESSQGNATPQVNVYPDRRTQFEPVAQVLAAAQRAHVSDLSLAPMP